MIALLLPVAAATPIQLYDLESNDGGFIESGETGQWAWGPVVNGPGASYDGANAWSTGLTRDYLNDTLDYLEVIVPDLSAAERPMFSFHQWYDIAMGDAGWVEVDVGNGWSEATPLYGYPTGTGWTGGSGGWQTVVFDLSGDGPTPRIRFAFQADVSGVAPGWTIDNVAFHDGDVAPPRITALDALGDTDDLVGPYTVGADAEDDSGVTAMTLWWTVGDVSTPVIMSPDGDGHWTGEIPAQAPDTHVSYFVVASDGLNEARDPEWTEETFRVYLPAPTGLTGPEGRVVATSATLSWFAPVTQNEVLSYEVVGSDGTVYPATDTTLDVPLTGGEQGFMVRGIYEAGPGDLSAEVTVDGLLPTVSALSPGEAYAGETLRVRLTGEYLLLVEGEVQADLGDGVTVVGVDVRDVDDAWLDLVLDAEAVAGPRALHLSSGDIVLDVPDAFDVLPASDRPHLASIEPASVRQGDSGTLAITFVGALAAVPEVDLGDGVVVEDVTVEDDTLQVHYAVVGTAALGPHAVTADDGVRVLSGVTLEVKDAVAPPANTCGTPTPPGTALVGLGLLLVRRRRRR